MTTRQLITRYLNRNNNRTATQIAKAIGKSAGLVSGILSTDRKARTVVVARVKGPRGGVVYASYKK